MADLARLLGADRVTEEHGVLVLTPRDDAEIATVLAAATADGLRLAVRGGGTKAQWRHDDRPVDAVLSTRALDGVVDHQPGDMTLVARAGTRLVDVQAAVTADAAHAQRLMLDPIGGPDATLGGIAATRAAGPRRHRYGTPRDIVIGARYVTGDGIRARTGGTVVKNVAGYDVAKLLIGAAGSLAVITELAVKLHPVPSAARTAVLRTTDAAAASRFVADVGRAPVTPTAVEVRWPAGLVAVRIESTAAGADAQIEVLRGLGAVEVLDDADGDALIDEQVALPLGGSGAVLGVGVRPTDLPALLDAVAAVGAALTARAALVAGEALLPDDDPDRVQRLVDDVRALGGTVAPRRGVHAHRAAAHAPDPGVALLEAALRTRLDPAGVLA